MLIEALRLSWGTVHMGPPGAKGVGGPGWGTPALGAPSLHAGLVLLALAVRFAAGLLGAQQGVQHVEGLVLLF